MPNYKLFTKKDATSLESKSYRSDWGTVFTAHTQSQTVPCILFKCIILFAYLLGRPAFFNLLATSHPLFNTVYTPGTKLNTRDV